MPSDSSGGRLSFLPNCTNSTAYQNPGITVIGHGVEHGPLCRFQERLWDGRLWWFGNRVSDLRYWLWRLCR